ncbi:MAG: hypothetical protein WDM89_13225 [Rhizomicrobium sp.]
MQLSDRTWARLADGTPLVTAEQRGKGWIVLFHISASPTWSSLPLSGLYVDMLRRLLMLSNGTNPASSPARPRFRLWKRSTALAVCTNPKVTCCLCAHRLCRKRYRREPIRRACMV